MQAVGWSGAYGPRDILALALVIALAFPPGVGWSADSSATDPSAQGAGQESGDASPESDLGMTTEELEELLGPIALYPDELLAVVLPASTYPIEIVQASRFLEKHKSDPDLKPSEEWDTSVLALLNYPEVLQLMNGDLDWTWKLGEAVAQDQDAVMDAVQSFRHRVQDAGNLQTNEQQKVVVEKETIIIESASTEVIYVPTYQPAQVVVVQSTPYPYYYSAPYPYYYNPHAVFWTGMFVGTAVAFGIGWGRYGGYGRYGGGNININKNININNPGGGNRPGDRPGGGGDRPGNRPGGGGDAWKPDKSKAGGRPSARDQATRDRKGASTGSRDRAGSGKRDGASAGSQDRASTGSRDRAGGGGRDGSGAGSRDRSSAGGKDRASAGTKDRSGGGSRDRASSGTRDRSSSASSRQGSSSSRSRQATSSSSWGSSSSRGSQSSRSNSGKSSMGGYRSSGNSRSHSSRGSMSRGGGGGGRSRGGGGRGGGGGRRR